MKISSIKSTISSFNEHFTKMEFLFNFQNEQIRVIIINNLSFFRFKNKHNVNDKSKNFAVTKIYDLVKD